LLDYDGVTAVVYGIAVSPDGRRLAAGLGDLKILLWDLAAGTLLHTFELRTGGSLGLIFTKDGRELIAGMGDGSIWIGGLTEHILGETDPAPTPPAKKKSGRRKR
jgi:WD40 repeat protein